MQQLSFFVVFPLINRRKVRRGFQSFSENSRTSNNIIFWRNAFSLITTGFEMNYFSAVVAALVLIVNNASQAYDSFDDQDVCDVKYHLHEDLASVLADPVGLKTLNEARESTKNICMDPRAHNAIVDLLDVVTSITTDPNVSATLGRALYWTRKALKEKNFRVVWLEEMKGLNMLFDNVNAVRPLVDTVLDMTARVLRSDDFDSSFDSVVKTLAPALGMVGNNKILSLAARMGNVIQQRSSATAPGNSRGPSAPVGYSTVDRKNTGNGNRTGGY